MDTPNNNKLTPHIPGSIREYWHISAPLMLSALSINSMMVLDRIILAKYSLHAMNGVATAGMIFLVIQFFAISTATIAEVFVGQHNGAKEYQKVGTPVWQMIWFSLLCMLFFIPIGLYAAEALIVDIYQDAALPYFKWLVYCGFLFPMNAALASFYIGLGKVRIIIITTLIGNVINLILDIVLIFGIDDYIPSMGTEGAGIATVVSQAIQVIILAIPFLSAKYHLQYHTRYCAFKYQVFKQCLKIGLPNAIGHSIEMTAWAVILSMVALISEMHMTCVTIGQGLFIFIAFTADGMGKATTALASNVIGSNEKDLVPKILKSSLKLLAILVVIFTLPTIIYPEVVISLFVDSDEAILQNPDFIYYVKLTLFWVWCYFIFDSITWLIAGVLTASGDTIFVMLMNAFGAWFFACIPVYYFVFINNGSPSVSWFITFIYGLMNAIFFYLRFRQGKWRQINLIS